MKAEVKSRNGLIWSIRTHGEAKLTPSVVAILKAEDCRSGTRHMLSTASQATVVRIGKAKKAPRTWTVFKWSMLWLLIGSVAASLFQSVLAYW
jgi:hypothetical protein